MMEPRIDTDFRGLEKSLARAQYDRLAIPPDTLIKEEKELFPCACIRCKIQHFVFSKNEVKFMCPLRPCVHRPANNAAI